MNYQTATIRLPIIPEPQKGSAAILFCGGGIISDGPINLTCGHCFHLLGKNLHPNQLQNIVLKCPKCLHFNAVVSIPTLEAIVTKLQSHPNILASVPGLSELISKSQKNDSSPSDIISHIEKQIPDFSWLKDILVPHNAGEFYGFLSFVMAFLVWYQGRKNNTAKHQAPVVINNYFQSQDPFNGVGRNDPCPCGSGNKFKRCHMREKIT